MATALPAPCDESIRIRSGATPCISETGTLAATVLGSSLAFMVGSIINVALPAIQVELGTDAAGAQWIVNAYLLPLSALVLVGGSLGDHYGRKNCFLVGLAVFFCATIGCSLAPDLSFLLAMRFLQGAGAALLAPNSLAIIADAFEGERRGEAVGIWAAAGAVTGAAAPLLGGLVIDAFGWRWAFAIVLPAAIAAGLIGWRYVRDSKAAKDDRGPLDWAGAGLATLFLASLVYTLITISNRDGSEQAVALTVSMAIASGIGFLAVERRKADKAMLPLRVFASRCFTGISLLTLLLYAAVGGLMVLLPYTLIAASGYSATAAGAALLPFPLIIAALSRRLGGLATRIGVGATLGAGSALVAAGFAMMALLASPDFLYFEEVMPGLIITAIGMSFCVAPLTTAVMNSVEKSFTGVASGINNAVSRVAGLVATSLLGFVLIEIAQGTTDILLAFQAAALAGAGLAVASAVVALVLIRDGRKS